MSGSQAAMAADPDAWKRGLTTIAVLYRIAECGERLHISMLGSELMFIEPSIETLREKGLIDIGGDDHYVVSPQGHALLRKVVEKTFAIRQFDVFGAVDLTRQLLEEEMHPEEAGQVHAHLHDPRFAETANSEDLRLAMLTWLGEFMGDKLPGVIDPREVVFIQKLAEGKFRSDRFWTDLRVGVFFSEVEAIVDSAYKWTDIGDTFEEQMDRMRGLYACGMLEVQRRSGPSCSKCKAPLGLVPEDVSECPACGTVFGPSAEEQAAAAGFSCANCSADVARSDRFCRGCGATVDFSGVPGQVTTTTTVTETEESVDGFGDMYGYSYRGQPFYDPWDPYVNAVAFGCLAYCLYDPYYW